MSKRNIAWSVAVAMYFVLTFFIMGFAWKLGATCEVILSLGQLFIAIILLPAAIIGFAVAIHEFRKSQAKPDIDLHWEIGPDKTGKEFALEVPLSGNARWSFRPVLLNEGTAASVWYLVDFKIPNQLSPEWRRIVGEDGNWRQSMDGEGHLYTFMSNGQVAALPNYGLLLGKVWVNLDAQTQYQQEYQVPYTIVTGEGQRRDNHLSLRLCRKVGKSPRETAEAETGHNLES